MIVGILTDPGNGGTFLSWTIHFLSGHTHYYNAKVKEVLPLTSNPLTALNAHNFSPNQPSTEEQFHSMFSDLKSVPGEPFHTLYFHILHTIVTDDRKGPNFKPTRLCAEKVQNETNKVVVLYTAESNQLYFSKFKLRMLSLKFDSMSEMYSDVNEQYEGFIDTFFADSKKVWDISTTWDRREFLALNLRPYEYAEILQCVDQSIPHFKLESFDLFNQFDKTVQTLFDYLQVDLDHSRWDEWLEVYREWQFLHADSIQFVDYFDTIIDSIINNYYLDLTRFNLDIIRESVIQHTLIYKHGLTIKGYGLEKFPANAQDLHKLLEKNVYHKVENIYGVL